MGTRIADLPNSDHWHVSQEKIISIYNQVEKRLKFSSKQHEETSPTHRALSSSELGKFLSGIFQGPGPTICSVVDPIAGGSVIWVRKF